MNRIDPYLYNMIKEITGLPDSDIEPIFKKLHSQYTWSIDDIEREAVNGAN